MHRGVGIERNLKIGANTDTLRRPHTPTTQGRISTQAVQPDAGYHCKATLRGHRSVASNQQQLEVELGIHPLGGIARVNQFFSVFEKFKSCLVVDGQH